MNLTNMDNISDVKWYNPISWIVWLLHWLFIGTDPSELESSYHGTNITKPT